MADDLKISDMVEVTSGNLHNDLQFEVMDPNEVAVEDQNKRVKLVTLEASFGAEDKIFKNDTLVQAFGTGVDAVTMQMELDDIGGVHVVFRADGQNNRVDIGRTDALFLRMGVGSDPDFRVMSGTDYWLRISPDYQRLGPTGAGNCYWEVDQSPLEIEGWLDGTQEFSLTVDGLMLKAGARVNDIETTLTDDDTHLPTSGAVVDAIAAISIPDPDKIIEGNSSVEVIDAGTGQVDVTVDSALVARFLTGGILELGQADLVFGALKLFGQATGSAQGGKIILETAADHDSGIPSYNEFLIQANENDLIFGTTSQPDALKYEPASQIWAFTQGTLYVGENLTVRGVVNAFGGTTTGGRLLVYNAADSDDTIGHYSLETSGEDMQLGPNTDPDALTYLAATNHFQFTNAAGIQLAAGATVNDIETALTDDDTHLPTSGAVVDAIGAATPLQLNFSGQKRVEAQTNGASVWQGANECRLEFGLADFYIYNFVNNGKVEIWGHDSGGGGGPMLACDPNNGVSMYNNGTKKVEVGPDTLELNGDQTGAEAIGNVATTVAITFGTAHADANYQVLATVENTTDGGPLVLAAIITAKATTGFTATLSAATDSANYVLNWLVVRS